MRYKYIPPTPEWQPIALNCLIFVLINVIVFSALYLKLENFITAICFMPILDIIVLVLTPSLGKLALSMVNDYFPQ